MKALDVAAYFLERHGAINAMKLQKVVYYSQAWFLVEYDECLFPDEIQAWAYEPVIYALYNVHRGSLIVQAVPMGDAVAVKRNAKAEHVVNAVWSAYGGLDSSELSRLTHFEAPWREARRKQGGERGRWPISIQTMREFYLKQPRPRALLASEFG